jgi:hypothetical protein
MLDEELIARFIGKGFTVQYVADYFDVHIDTLYARYSDALRKGRSFREGCLQAKQFHKAMKGDTTLLIWLGKQWLGQRDKIEMSDPNEANFGIGDSPKPQINNSPELIQ